MTYFTFIIDEKQTELVSEITLLVKKYKPNNFKCWCLDTPIEFLEPIFAYVKRKEDKMINDIKNK